MKLQFFIIAIAAMLISCNNADNNKPIAQVENQDNKKVAITAKALEKLKYKDYTLSNEAERLTTNWLKYRELAVQINYLKKADLSFFQSEKKVLKTFMDSLSIQIPDTLSTNPITSRAMILETKLLKLNDNLGLNTLDTQTKIYNIREVLEAFSNLNYQINKKLERDTYNKIQPE